MTQEQLRDIINRQTARKEAIRLHGNREAGPLGMELVTAMHDLDLLIAATEAKEMDQKAKSLFEGSSGQNCALTGGR